MPELLMKCVNAHERCHGGAGGPCPYCEPITPLRTVDGRFAKARDATEKAGA